MKTILEFIVHLARIYLQDTKCGNSNLDRSVQLAYITVRRDQNFCYCSKGKNLRKRGALPCYGYCSIIVFTENSV